MALAQTEETVRTTLEYLKGLDLSLPWPTEIELSDDPLEKAWQLAGISPLGTLDHQDLLNSSNLVSLLETTHKTVDEALEIFRLTRSGDE